MTTANPSLIHCDPRVMDGVTVFVDSRLPVATLLACVNAGTPWERIVASWPWLTLAHLDAAREWAATGVIGASGHVPKASVSQAHHAPRRPSERPRVLYLGISGVLHPSASLYELVYGRSPWDDGHCQYEAVDRLSTALNSWSDVRIVLTSTQPWKHGLPAVLKHLGTLAERVLGFTFEDLTTKVVRHLRTRSGTTRQLTYSSEDYWRLNKADIVKAHVEWLKPDAWVVVDDEDILWPKLWADHVCIVDGLEGLKNPAEEGRLLTYLALNFGQGDQR